jgi:high-affinity nickel-transport protein
MNIVILVGIWKHFLDVQRGGTFCNEDLDLLLNRRGLMARLLRPLFRLVTQRRLLTAARRAHQE